MARLMMVRRLIVSLLAASTIAVALEMGGLVILAFGAYLIWTPAALFVLGIGMILFAQGMSK